MFGMLFKLLKIFTLFANSIVILHEKRFLRRIGLPLDPDSKKCLGTTRVKTTELIKTTKLVLRLPLIILNLVCIIHEVFFG